MEEILKYIEQYGFMTVFAGATLFLLIKFGLLKYKKIAQDYIEGDVADPINHIFFQKIDYLITYKIPQITLKYKDKECFGRTLIFQEMLKTKFVVWKSYIKTICEKDWKQMSNDEIRTTFLKALVELVHDYETQWEKDGIPKIVITKFHKWHDNHAQMLMESIENISRGTSFGSKKEIMNAILEVNNTMLILTILDAEKTLGEMDGELSGLTFKGAKLI